MDRKLTALEVIGMAIRGEEDAALFYEHMADIINNELEAYLRDKEWYTGEVSPMVHMGP
ncbi:MAG: hypothetical protein PVI06_06140 [Desulfobacterales bacterium]